MRHGGGGLGNDHSNNPTHAQVGLLTAGLTFLALFHVLTMPIKRPNMFGRVMISAVLMVPFTLMAGDPPYMHTWWVILLFLFGGWVSEADD